MLLKKSTDFSGFVTSGCHVLGVDGGSGAASRSDFPDGVQCRNAREFMQNGHALEEGFRTKPKPERQAQELSRSLG